MRKEKIAVLGDSDITLVFKAVGMDVYNANSVGEASEKLKLLARNYSVIFITEDLAVQIEEQIAKFKNRTYPAIIPIPSSKGSTGYEIGRASCRERV